MSANTANKHKKRKAKSSKPHTVSSQAEADALRHELVGETPVVKTKMPKLSGPFPAPQQDSIKYHPVPGKPNLLFYSDLISDNISVHGNLPGQLFDNSVYPCLSSISAHHACVTQPDPCFVGNISNRKTHQMSDSEEDIPGLVGDDAEEGELVDDESGYYGWYASPQNNYQGQFVDNPYGGGTTEEYHFSGGFGRGRPGPVLQQEPSYLGVGENFYDFGSDQIEVFQQGEGPSILEEDQFLDFDGVEDDEVTQPGGPSDLDLQLDEVGTVPIEQENTGQDLPSIVERANISVQAPSYFVPPTTKLAPSSEQVKSLMKIAETHRPQGLQPELVNREPDISISSYAKSPLPDPQGSVPKVRFSAPVSQPTSLQNSSVVSPQGTQPVAPQGNFAQAPSQAQSCRPVAMPSFSQAQAPVAQPATPTNQIVQQAPPLAVPVPTGPTNLDPSTGINFHPMVKNYHIKVKEETAPPLEESLAFIINDYFSRACTDIASLEIKDAYESLLRPANAQHLIKTELNPEFKTPKIGISKSGVLKDGHARGVQNAIIRMAVALSQIANEVVNPADPQMGPNGEKILDRAMTGLKVAAYGSQRCNTFRRFLLRPHLNNCFQYVCSEPISQLSVLLPPNLQDYVKIEKERTNRAIPLTKMGSRALQNQNRKKRGGRQLEVNLDIAGRTNNLSTSILGNNRDLVRAKLSFIANQHSLIIMFVK